VIVRTPLQRKKRKNEIWKKSFFFTIYLNVTVFEYYILNGNDQKSSPSLLSRHFCGDDKNMGFEKRVLGGNKEHKEPTK